MEAQLSAELWIITIINSRLSEKGKISFRIISSSHLGKVKHIQKHPIIISVQRRQNLIRFIFATINIVFFLDFCNPGKHPNLCTAIIHDILWQYIPKSCQKYGPNPRKIWWYFNWKWERLPWSSRFISRLSRCHRRGFLVQYQFSLSFLSPRTFKLNKWLDNYINSTILRNGLKYILYNKSTRRY